MNTCAAACARRRPARRPGPPRHAERAAGARGSLAPGPETSAGVPTAGRAALPSAESARRRRGRADLRTARVREAPGLRSASTWPARRPRQRSTQPRPRRPPRDVSTKSLPVHRGARSVAHSSRHGFAAGRIRKPRNRGAGADEVPGDGAPASRGPSRRTSMAPRRRELIAGTVRLVRPPTAGSACAARPPPGA